jgi:hypothetical protein
VPTSVASLAPRAAQTTPPALTVPHWSGSQLSVETFVISLPETRTTDGSRHAISLLPRIPKNLLCGSLLSFGNASVVPFSAAFSSCIRLHPLQRQVTHEPGTPRPSQWRRSRTRRPNRQFAGGVDFGPQCQ